LIVDHWQARVPKAVPRLCITAFGERDWERL
jgi:hypothetical protein